MYRETVYQPSLADFQHRTFTVEKSGLNQLSYNFPSMQGRSFREWLSHVSRGGQARVIEVGGGVNQTAALEICEQFPVQFTALEPRDIKRDVLETLSSNSSFVRLQAPVEDLHEVLNGAEYDIAFAHYVAEHIGNPYGFLVDLSRYVRPGGVLFANRITGYSHTFEDFVEIIREQGAVVTYNLPRVSEGRLMKAGITRADIAIQMTKPLGDVEVSIGDRLRDFSGEILASHGVRFLRRAA